MFAWPCVVICLDKSKHKSRKLSLLFFAKGRLKLKQKHSTSPNCKEDLQKNKNYIDVLRLPCLRLRVAPTTASTDEAEVRLPTEELQSMVTHLRCKSQRHGAASMTHLLPLWHISSSHTGEDEATPELPPSSDLFAHHHRSSATGDDGPEKAPHGDSQIIPPFAKEKETTNLTTQPETRSEAHRRSISRRKSSAGATLDNRTTAPSPNSRHTEEVPLIRRR